MGKTLLILNDPPYGTDAELVDGCRRSTMDELTDWAQWADVAVAF